jgi:cell division protein FtsL
VRRSQPSPHLDNTHINSSSEKNNNNNKQKTDQFFGMEKTFLQLVGVAQLGFAGYSLSSQQSYC